MPDPPGRVKFANAPPPELTGCANAPQLPGEGGWAQLELTDALDIIFHSNVVGVFEVCLELPSDLKDQFGFVAGEFSELEHTRKSLACLIPV